MIKTVKGIFKKVVAVGATFAIMITGVGTLSGGIFNPESSGIVMSASAAGTYNANAAVNYAYRYWSTYNSSYRNYNSVGGDCANFVSQCLKAGGIQTDNTWKTGSIAWINCKSQLSWLKSKGYQVVDWAKESDCRVGDVVYYYCGSSIAHTALVTKVTGGRAYVTAHNKNHKDYEWTLGGSRWWGGSSRRVIVHMNGSSNERTNTTVSVRTGDRTANWPSISSSKYMACYALSNSRHIRVYPNANLNTPESGRYVWGDSDELRVFKIAQNSKGQWYIFFSYPVGNSRRNAYAPLSVIAGVSKPTAIKTATSQITAYKKANTSSYYGYVSANDQVLVCGTSGGSLTRVVYPVTNSRNQTVSYKMAFVKTTDLNRKAR